MHTEESAQISLEKQQRLIRTEHCASQNKVKVLLHQVQYQRVLLQVTNLDPPLPDTLSVATMTIPSNVTISETEFIEDISIKNQQTVEAEYDEEDELEIIKEAEMENQAEMGSHVLTEEFKEQVTNQYLLDNLRTQDISRQLIWKSFSGWKDDHMRRVITKLTMAILRKQVQVINIYYTLYIFIFTDLNRWINPLISGLDGDLIHLHIPRSTPKIQHVLFSFVFDAFPYPNFVRSEFPF